MLSSESAYLHHVLPLAYTQNILPDLNGFEEEAPLDLSATSRDRLDDDYNKPQVELKVPQIQTKIGLVFNDVVSHNSLTLLMDQFYIPTLPDLDIYFNIKHFMQM